MSEDSYVGKDQFKTYNDLVIAQLRDLRSEIADRFQRNEDAMAVMQETIARAAGRAEVQDFRDLERRVSSLEHTKEFLSGKVAMVGAIVGSLGGLAGVATMAWNLFKAAAPVAGK